MANELTPRELALAKKAARTVRIRNIRRRVAYSAATLAALFSGLAVMRPGIDQISTAAPSQTASVTRQITPAPEATTAPLAPVQVVPATPAQAPAAVPWSPASRDHSATGDRSPTGRAQLRRARRDGIDRRHGRRRRSSGRPGRRGDPRSPAPADPLRAGQRTQPAERRPSPDGPGQPRACSASPAWSASPDA